MARVRGLLLDTNPDADTNAGALAELLEGALAAVSPEFAEDCIVQGRDGGAARAWRSAMGGDLFSPKVTALFQELWKHRKEALAALDKARFFFCSQNLSCRYRCIQLLAACCLLLAACLPLAGLCRAWYRQSCSDCWECS